MIDFVRRLRGLRACQKQVRSGTIAGSLGLLTLILLFVGGVGTAVAAEDPEAGACPNESLRYGLGAQLPDCRAYEQASPIDKNGNNIQRFRYDVQAAANGDGITYYVNGGLPGSEGGADFSTYASLRLGGQWTVRQLLGKAEVGSLESFTYGESEDLRTNFLFGYPYPETERESIFEQNLETNEYSLIQTGAFNTVYGTEYFGSSADDNQALLAGSFPPGAEEGGVLHVYVWNRPTKQLILAGVFNDGSTPAAGALPAGRPYAGGFFAQQEHVISTDATHVVFSDLGTDQLYVRENPLQPQSAMSGTTCTEPTKACTYMVSESVRTIPDPIPARPAYFVSASASGEDVYFMSASKLTDNANTGPNDETNNLYRYNTVSHNLTDLTPSSETADPIGSEAGGVLGMSADGSRIYFAAGGVLGDGATKGVTNTDACHIVNDSSEEDCNIYVWDEGQIDFLFRANGHETPKRPEWVPYLYLPGDGIGTPAHTSRVSASGRILEFLSRQNLTGYDSKEHTELYRYELGNPNFTCLSCLPSDEPPTEDVTFEGPSNGVAPGYHNHFYPRTMSLEGERIFFETPDSLVPSDTNGVNDVYEWEEDGTGSCRSTSQNGGCLYLISSGTSPQPSYFGDASESGDDVYFFTTQGLVGQDQDQLVDVYDARVDGGLASQNPTYGSPCASAEACRGGAAAAAAAEARGSSTFSGPGNPVVKQKHHKKKHQKKKHHTKKHQKKKHHQGKRTKTQKQQSRRQEGDNR